GTAAATLLPYTTLFRSDWRERLRHKENGLAESELPSCGHGMLINHKRNSDSTWRWTRWSHGTVRCTMGVDAHWQVRREAGGRERSEEHTSELQSPDHLV